MAKTVVITDSVACLTKEHAQKYHIEVVPINIFFNDTEMPGNRKWKN